MILADTSIWVDHFRSHDTALAALLNEARVLIHPFVIGELSLGNLRQRETVLKLLRGLAQANEAENDEVLAFIDLHGLARCGIGLVDAHLLASTRLTAGASFWTRDKRLREIATQLGIGANLSG